MKLARLRAPRCATFSVTVLAAGCGVFIRLPVPLHPSPARYRDCSVQVATADLDACCTKRRRSEDCILGVLAVQFRTCNATTRNTMTGCSLSRIIPRYAGLDEETATLFSRRSEGGRLVKGGLVPSFLILSALKPSYVGVPS